MRKTYRIEVDCANCAAKMEDAVRKTDGVHDATVNFMIQKLIVDFDEEADIPSVMKRAVSACKIVEDDCEIFL